MENTYRSSRLAICLPVLLTVCGAAAPAYAQLSCPSSSYSFSPSRLYSPNFPPSGVLATAGRHEVAVTAPAGCTWTAGSQLPWITIAAGTSGTGNGTVVLDVADNPGDFRFAGDLLQIADRPFLLGQNGCLSVLVEPGTAQAIPGYESRLFIDASGGTRFLKVNPASAACAWAAESHVPWITISPGNTGGGPGIVRYSVSPNFPIGSVARAGTLTVGYLTFTIHQTIAGAADMNGDHYADLLWQHRTTGHVATWVMRERSLIDGRLLTPGQLADLGWKIGGAADFDHDGHTDILWQHDDGRLAVWQMNDTTMMSGALTTAQTSPQDPDWRVRSVADLNSDGRADLIWQHRVTGQLKAWLMFDGSNRLFEATFAPGAVPDTSWQIVGAADFNRDGQIDLLWQNQANGLISVWKLEWSAQLGWSVTSGELLNPGQVSDTNWKIRGVADIDRDGQPDLIWQNQSTGQISTWLMNGTSLREGTLFLPGTVADTNWEIVGPR